MIHVIVQHILPLKDFSLSFFNLNYDIVAFLWFHKDKECSWSLVPTPSQRSTAPSQKTMPDLTVYFHGPVRINSTFWDLYFSAIMSQNIFH